MDRERMITVVTLGNLEVKRKEGGGDFRVYSVFEGDKVLLTDAHFKEAVDFVNKFPQSTKDEVDENELRSKLPPDVEAVFLYDRDTATISASLGRAEAEQVFQEETNCIPKIGSVLMMSPEGSDNLIEKIVQSVEFVGQKTLIIFLGGT